MNKKSITKYQYYQLVGMMTLASKKMQEVKEMESAIAEIVGEKNDGQGYYGHTSDCVYNSENADMLLRKLKLTVGKLVR